MKSIIVKDTLFERLDKAVLKQFPEVGIGKLNKFLRENKIKVNGKKQPLSYRLKKGDEINLYFPDKQSVYLTQESKICIVYEDDYLLIADKQAGLPVEGVKGSDSLLRRCEDYLSAKSPHSNAFLCHRLDTGTSGLVIIAKSSQAFDAVAAQIKARKIVKEYVCVTFGHPKPKCAALRAWLTKNAADGIVYIDDKQSAKAKEIITEYETLATSGPLALVCIKLITGRTHQIRAHMAHIGCPLLGDSKYGINSVNRSYKLKYQALCAYSLSFPRLNEASLSAVSQRSFTAKKPWFYNQILTGELGEL